MERRKDSKGRVLKTGESQRKDGTYMFRKMINGQSICKYAATLNQLREIEKELNQDLYFGINICSKNESLKNWIQRMLNLKYNIKETTKELYLSYFKQLCKYSFLDIEINKLTESKIKMFYIQLKEDGYKKGTISNYHMNIIKPALKLAFRDNVIRKNPADFQLKEVFSPENNEKFALTDNQCKMLFTFLLSDKKRYEKHYDLLVILLETGLRASELCGLTKDDIDFKKKRISVNKQLVYVNREYHITKPKSRAGVRFIPMNQKCYNAFKKVIEERHTKIEPIIDGYKGFVFITEKGKPYVRSNINGYIKSLTNAFNSKYGNKLPHITAHTFRHTFCSRLINKGVDLKTIQYLMGHSSINVSLNVYGHATYETSKAAFEKSFANGW